MEDDYLIDEDEELDEDGYFQQTSDEDEDDDLDIESESSDDVSAAPNRETEKLYETRMSKTERWLLSAYDDIVAVARNSSENAVEDAANILLEANPKHTSQSTRSMVSRELFHKQGHARMVNSKYTPDTQLTGEDVDMDYRLDDNTRFNRVFAQSARDQIARFIGYLANRDLSKDSITSKKRKQRHIPAFIIYLFSSGQYDLIINCPTMPKVYADQISNSLSKIIQMKYDLVEELAKKYEEAGRPKVADRVRKLQLSWFLREPAEIRTISEYNDLDLTYDDVVIYREYRNRFTNMSKSITQDVISDMIEVVVGDGIYEKLKDKTRAEAIIDVKQVYKDWAKENSTADKELSSQIIWNKSEDNN